MNIPTRLDVVKEAEKYIDVPYHHMGTDPTKALDCAGLIVLVGKNLGFIPQEHQIPTYDRQPDGRSIMKYCKEWLGERKTVQELDSGMILVLKPENRPQHLGIVGERLSDNSFSIIHASNTVHPARVVKTRLMFRSNLKFEAAFDFRGVSDG